METLRVACLLQLSISGLCWHAHHSVTQPGRNWVKLGTVGQPHPQLRLHSGKTVLSESGDSGVDFSLIGPIQALPAKLAAEVIRNNFKSGKRNEGQAPAVPKGKGKIDQDEFRSSPTATSADAVAMTRAAAAPDALAVSAAAATAAAAAVQTLPARLAAEIINGKFKVAAMQAEITTKDRDLAVSAALLRESLIFQHASRQIAETEAAAASTALEKSEAAISELTKNYGELMVKSHEAKLAAVAAAAAEADPLRDEVASLARKLEVSEATTRAVQESSREAILELAVQAKANTSAAQAELIAGRAAVVAAEAKAAQLEAALEEYMVLSHLSRIDEAKQQQNQIDLGVRNNEEETRNVERADIEELRRLRSELMLLQAERDEYIREREMELAALGDGLPPV